MKALATLKLVRRFHRWLVMAATVRAVGRSAAVAAGSWVVTALAARWLGWPAEMVVIAAFSAGVACAIWHRRRWPGLLSAAVRLDAQCGTDELYSTALSATRRGDASAMALAAMASGDAAAARQRLEQLDVGGYAPWAWVVALLLAGAMPAIWTWPGNGTPLTSPVVAGESSSHDRAEAARSRVAAPWVERVFGPSATEASHRSAMITDEAADSDEGGGGDGGRMPGQAAGTSPGGGMATGGMKKAMEPETVSGAVRSDGTGSGGRSDGGMGQARRASGSAEAGGVGVVTPEDGPALLSNSGGEPGTSAEGSLQALESVPSEYRDVVQAYFER